MSKIEKLKAKAKVALPTIAAASALGGAFALGIAYVVVKTKAGMIAEERPPIRTGSFLVLEEVEPDVWTDMDWPGVMYEVKPLS